MAQPMTMIAVPDFYWQALRRAALEYERQQKEPNHGQGTVVGHAALAFVKKVEVDGDEPPHRCSKCQTKKRFSTDGTLVSLECPGCRQREYCDDGCRSCKGQKKRRPR